MLNIKESSSHQNIKSRRNRLRVVNAKMFISMQSKDQSEELQKHKIPDNTKLFQIQRLNEIRTKKSYRLFWKMLPLPIPPRPRPLAATIKTQRKQRFNKNAPKNVWLENDRKGIPSTAQVQKRSMNRR